MARKQKHEEHFGGVAEGGLRPENWQQQKVARASNSHADGSIRIGASDGS